MNPSEYLEYSALDLSECSHSEHPGRFGVFFSPTSSVSKFASTRQHLGNCTSYWNGRILVGSRTEGFVGIFTFLVGSNICVFSIVPLTWWSSVVIISSGILSFIFLFLTSFTNPGIIPRDESYDPALMKPHTVDTTTGLLRPRFILVNGVCVRQKFCRTCKVYRPPRSSHCSVCDNCVLRFDHHCPSLGTCIGLGNYRWFFGLVLALTVEAAAVVTVATEAVQEAQGNDWYHLVVLSVLAAVGFAAATLLLIYHTCISARNLTTNEHLKRYYKVNPFDSDNCWRNWAHCLFRPDRLFADSPLEADIAASYKPLASTNSECVSDFYDY
jgi:palmitoyltransferase ZDHHC9/14/18